MPSAFFVPFDRTADEGNPEIRTDSVSEPSVSVNAELMFSAIGAPALSYGLGLVLAPWTSAMRTLAKPCSYGVRNLIVIATCSNFQPSAQRR